MIKAFVGSGGKTTLLKAMAAQYRMQGKSVFVTTTTHMFIEDDTLLTDDADVIIQKLKKTGYAMAGIPEGVKIRALSEETYKKVCGYADIVLVEADGSRGMPLKFPDDAEPVIPDNAEEIIIVCGLNALGHSAKEVCHRLELVKSCLEIENDTFITPSHIQKLIQEGYQKPLQEKYPKKKISVIPRHDGSLYQRAIASMLQTGADVSFIREEWFCPQPRLIICGGGHVAKEVAALAAHLDFHIRVIDDRKDFVSEKRFPMADEAICDSYDNLDRYLEAGAYYVVVTPDHKADYQCVRTILTASYAYLGMIGSRKKVAATFERLKKDGVSDSQIRTIFAPIGLSIGAVTPSEIAFSILAQIIQEKNKAHAAFADRQLLEVKDAGILCIIIEKHGSTPRGVGSMMFVGENQILGSIGGGEVEHQVICHAKEQPVFAIRKYVLNNISSDGLDMVCGGTVQVMFIPVSEHSGQVCFPFLHSFQL